MTASKLLVKREGDFHYPICFEEDFSNLAQVMKEEGLVDRKICIVTDSNVGPLYEESVRQVLSEVSSDISVFTFEAGEKNKNLNTVSALYQVLIKNGLDRKSLLVALGGGVVGDLTGYTAATYLRGIEFIQIPTTLLSQADSSIGGKTGVDFDGYKNMVGAFYMPRLVYMNMETLQSLSDRQFYSGFAEVMKSALIKDGNFYEWLIDRMYEICERDVETLAEMVERSCMIKKLVVEKDPLEKGDRALLNFGHTIGHAIEKYMNFTMTHGECVALGCVAAAFISWKKNWLSMEEYYEIRDMFVPFYLPISIDNLDIEEVLQLTKSDKKAENGYIKFILLRKVGKALIDKTVTDDEIREALQELNFNEND